MIFFLFFTCIYSDTTKIILGGHMYGLAGKDSVTNFPAPSFMQGIDKFTSIEPDAYIAGGDLTFKGTTEQWNNLYGLFESKWDFPFIPVIGNHDLENMDEWESRVGKTYRTIKIDSTLIILLHSIEYPNSALSDEQSSWLEEQLTSAASNNSVNDILIAQHHLFWTKAIDRYEKVYQLGNAWYCEYKTQGYDVNNFMEDSWPQIAHLASQKPVTFFCGDAGFAYGSPSLFYDTLDNVTLLACGYDAYGRKDKDAVIIYYSTNGNISYQSLSPYDTTFENIDFYNLDYWNKYFDSKIDNAKDFDTLYIEEKFANIIGGQFYMGSHINPRNLKYSQNTNHSVTISNFSLSKTEVTVSEYLAFLNASDRDNPNQYCGYQCIDLDDPECQIAFNGTEFISKSSKYLDLPIIEVSWHGAIAYCNYLSESNGLEKCYIDDKWNRNSNGYRLPTEAEFEFAQRGGEGFTLGKKTYFRFYWSDNSPDHAHDHANYYGTGGRDKWLELSPIASFPPNQFGLYDMAGNAFEWVYDKHKPWYLMGGDEANPVYDSIYEYPNDTIRTIRGGGFNFHWSACMNYYRSGEIAKKSNSYIGFRVARGISVDNSNKKYLKYSSLMVSNNNIILNFKSNAPGKLKIEILNLKGQSIATLYKSSYINRGKLIVPFNKRNYSKGIYLLSVKLNNLSLNKKIILK